MIYGSVCSGIESATVAWEPLGWTPAFFSEIEDFPRAVLSHHYPDVPLHGDFTTIKDDDYGPIDVLVGGTPCQSFSLAGLRRGLDDDRGALALEFLRLVERKRPRWVVWENVPGVLSNDGGRTFGTILGGLGECGYGFAYRVLDAQYFGVPQRRRRVFVVGHSGGTWQRAAAVLLERESMQGHPAPRREKGEEVAGPIGSLSSTGGFRTTDLDGQGAFVANEKPISFTANDFGADAREDVSPPIRSGMHDKSNANGGVPPAICWQGGDYIQQRSYIRRLTPLECERLQGLPDNYTRIAWKRYSAEDCPDGPRYRTIGNAMAVPVMRWIGERIKKVEQIEV